MYPPTHFYMYFIVTLRKLNFAKMELEAANFARLFKKIYFQDVFQILTTLKSK